MKVRAAPIGEVTLAGTETGKVSLAVRPEKIFVAESEPTDPKVIAVKGKVGEVAYFGSYSNVFFDIGTYTPLQADISNVTTDVDEFTFTAGEEYWVYWRKADTLVLGA